MNPHKIIKNIIQIKLHNLLGKKLTFAGVYNENVNLYKTILIEKLKLSPIKFAIFSVRKHELDLIKLRNSANSFNH